MQINRRIRILSVLVVVYMISALTWWAILLNRKNDEVYHYQNALLQENIDIPSFKDETTVLKLNEIDKKFNRQRKMIFGEALVFALALIVGIILIYRSFIQELKISFNHKNFLLSITHEFKSPLSAIKLVLDTLLNRNLVSSQIKNLAGSAMEDTVRLETLVNNILFTTKIESKYQFNFELINLNERINEVADRLLKSYPHHQIRVDCSNQIALEADREALGTLIFNVLDNALKYSSPSSIVIIKATQDAEKTEIIVSDLGIGIPDSEKKVVFDKFYRVGSEETRKTKGTGIGLYLVKHITDSHQGQINLEDNSPQGTIFKAVLPNKQE